MISPINELQSKATKIQDKKLGKPSSFLERLQPLADNVQALVQQPKIMLTQPNTDSLARVFIAVLDLANAMDVTGEDLLRITGQRLEIDKLKMDQDKILAKAGR